MINPRNRQLAHLLGWKVTKVLLTEFCPHVKDATKKSVWLHLTPPCGCWFEDKRNWVNENDCWTYGTPDFISDAAFCLWAWNRVLQDARWQPLITHLDDRYPDWAIHPLWGDCQFTGEIFANMQGRGPMGYIAASGVAPTMLEAMVECMVKILTALQGVA